MKAKILINNQNGAVIVEFAILVPLLILLAIGLCEFGLLCYNSQIIVNASREGARAGITRRNDSLITDPNNTYGINYVVVKYCEGRLIDFGGSATPVISYPDGENVAKSFGEDFSVEVQYQYKFMAPGILGLGTTKIITRRTVMRMEQIPS